jgi:Flp pilus assembly protein TadG
MPAIRCHRQRRDRQRQGIAAVELAVTLPAILLIVLGCIDFGRFAYTYIAVTNAARAGAGFLSMSSLPVNSTTSWERGFCQAVLDEMGSSFVTTSINVPSPVITLDSMGFRRASVQVSYPFSTLVSWPGIPNSMNLSRTVQMRLVRF